MSLLDRGTEIVTIYPEMHTVDADGNTLSMPDFEHPVQARVRIQPAAQSGTSARRAELHNEGWETEQVYLLRFAREDEFEPGVGAELDWNGTRWTFLGFPLRYSRSSKTARLEFTIRRS